MSATVNVYDALFLDGTLNDDSVGSLETSVKAFNLTADTVRTVGEEISVAVGESVTIWEYSATKPYFDMIRLQCLGGAGYLEVAIKSDAPTSSTDPIPLTTCISWNFIDLSCTAPLYLTSDEVIVNPVVGDGHNDNSGVPLKWSDAGTVAGRVYKVMVRNPSTASAAVRLSKTVLY